MLSPESESEVTQLCLTLCDPMDCSLPGSSVHGIFQARVLEWAVFWVYLKSTVIEAMSLTYFMLLIFALLWHKWPFGKMFALQSICKFSPETTLLAAFTRTGGNLWAPPWNYPLPLHLSLMKMRLCPTSHLLSWWGTTATCYPGLFLQKWPGTGKIVWNLSKQSETHLDRLIVLGDRLISNLTCQCSPWKISAYNKPIGCNWGRSNKSPTAILMNS